MIYTVEANQRTYTVVDDLTTTYQAIIAGQVIAAAGQPLRQFRVQVDNPNVFVKMSPDGFFALAGVINQLFPQLDTINYLLNVQIDAPNYQSQTITVDVLMGSSFPLPQLVIPMAYTPVRLQGRVTLDADGSPVAGANVRVTEPAQILVLRTPLHFEHSAGTAVNACTFSPDAPRTLNSPAALFDDRLTLDDASGIITGDILQLSDPAVEYIIVAGPGAHPGELLLRGGLRRSYPAGTVVREVTATAGAPSETTAQEAAAGDGLLQLVGVYPSGPAAVEIVDAVDPARNEYHLLNGFSDGEGYYRLDGIVRLDNLTLHAAAGLDVQERPWTIDPRQPVNVVNFRLAPP